MNKSVLVGGTNAQVCIYPDEISNRMQTRQWKMLGHRSLIAAFGIGSDSYSLVAF